MSKEKSEVHNTKINVYDMEGKLIDTCEDWIEFDDNYGGSDAITWEDIYDGYTYIYKD